MIKLNFSRIKGNGPLSNWPEVVSVMSFYVLNSIFEFLEVTSAREFSQNEFH